MELTWVLNKRKKAIVEENKVTFSVKIFQGKEYLQTLAPAEDPEGLAQLVLKSELRIDWNDKITTYSASRILPKRGYIEMPVSDDDMIRFYRKYWELVDGEVGREK